MRSARAYQLSFSPQNFRLSRMAAGHAACHADGSVQPLLLSDHEAVPGIGQDERDQVYLQINL